MLPDDFRAHLHSLGHGKPYATKIVHLCRKLESLTGLNLDELNELPPLASDDKKLVAELRCAARKYLAWKATFAHRCDWGDR